MAAKPDRRFVQRNSIALGVQQKYEPERTVAAIGLGAVTGGIGRTAVEGAAKAPDVIANRRLQGWRDATPNKTWDDHYRTAQRWQDELAGANERIAQEAGTRFVNPGIKKRETAEGKPARKGYSGPQEVTDVVRGAHMLERPDQADAVASSAGD